MNRLEKVRAELQRRELDALLVNKPENRAYLSGFTGSAGHLLVSRTGAHLVTDSRYVEQAAAQAPLFRVHKVGGAAVGPVEMLRSILKAEGIGQLGIEGDHVTVDTYVGYERSFTDVDLVTATGLVEGLRAVKDSDEVAAIRQAATITDAAFRHALEIIRPGMTERAVAVQLETFMKQQGASALAFELIVASGSRSSLPHGVASDKEIQPGELVTIDMGCIYNGYCSDMTRTVMVGEPDDKQREIYEIVLAAQQRGVAAARAGITGRELDQVCRESIRECGYADYFGHGTGHGVGRYIHEDPRISAAGEEVLVPGHVVTVEPGVYLSGWGGVRIEDLILITAEGCEVLSNSPKELIILE